MAFMYAYCVSWPQRTTKLDVFARIILVPQLYPDTSAGVHSMNSVAETIRGRV